MKKILFGFLALLLSLLPGCLQKNIRPAGDFTTYTLPDGSKFNHASSWQVSDAKSYLAIVGPEQDFFAYLLVENKAQVAQDDVINLWKKIKPDFSYPVLRVQAPPKDRGWERIEQLTFDVPAKLGKTVLAIALTFKDKNYWLLIEASNAALSRRAAELMLIVESLRPFGMGDESLADRKAKIWQEKEKQEFHKFLLMAKEKLNVPGAAILVVNKNGQAIFSDAIGVKDINTKEPVTTDTPFMIGSTTKALTTLMMARLVDQKVLNWETKIKDVLKDFKVNDQELMNKLDIKNSVSASTGMPRRDLEFIFKYKGISAEARLAELAFMAPTTKMGETFQYSNHLFMAGGYAAAKAYAKEMSLEASYQKAMSDLVFDPLGMKRSVIKSSQAKALGGALPHAKTLTGELIRLPLENEDAIYSVAPAGAVWSTVEDLAKYIAMELNDGKIDSKALLGKNALLERRKPGVNINGTNSYGLGLFIEDHQGIKIIGHDGNTLGFSSLLLFLPDHGLGMVILTNGYAATHFLQAAKQKFIELTFMASVKSAESVNYGIQSERQLLEQLSSRAKTDEESIAWIKDWIGTYDNETLGSFTIKSVPNGLELDCGEWKSAISSATESSGSRNIFLTTPPFFFTLQPEPKNHMLILDAGQQKYQFKKKDAQASSGFAR